jgi:type IV pilus assembly protein PilN
MIKINLLPVRAARKRENIKQQLITFVGLIALTVVGLYFWYHSASSTINDKNNEIKEIREEISRLDREIGDIDKFKGLETELTTKLEIIDNLLKNKTGPVRVMDRLSRIIPRKVWLLKWEEKGGNVILEGEALNNKDVGDFMEALEKPAEEDVQRRAASEEVDSAPIVNQPGNQPNQPGVGAKTATPSAVASTAKVSVPGKRYFTDIELKESALKDDKSVDQPFMKFSLKLKVKY